MAARGSGWWPPHDGALIVKGCPHTLHQEDPAQCRGKSKHHNHGFVSLQFFPNLCLNHAVLTHRLWKAGIETNFQLHYTIAENLLDFKGHYLCSDNLNWLCSALSVIWGCDLLSRRHSFLGWQEVLFSWTCLVHTTVIQNQNVFQISVNSNPCQNEGDQLVPAGEGARGPWGQGEIKVRGSFGWSWY